ncbi:hypothetical protein M1615_03985 [Patescibacteria group bacterium]|nr:hypothetical protein [Patescibacteria group bacterium]
MTKLKYIAFLNYFYSHYFFSAFAILFVFILLLLVRKFKFLDKAFVYISLFLLLITMVLSMIGNDNPAGVAAMLAVAFWIYGALAAVFKK